MTVREKSRLDKFKLLLASPSTDLGKIMFLLHNILLSSSQLPADWSAENLTWFLFQVLQFSVWPVTHTCSWMLISKRDLQMLAVL